jgi:hypothetical protein
MNANSSPFSIRARRGTANVASLLMGALALCAQAAEPVPEAKTLLTERGKLVLKEDFDQPPDKQWRISAPQWETAEGALKATHQPPMQTNHGPVMERRVALQNAVVQVSFKLEGKAHAVVHFNKKNGHLCRAVVRPEGFYLIRRDSGGDKGIRLDFHEKPFAPGEWHTLVLEILGTEMVASLDGKEVLAGTRDDLDQPKTALLLESAGGTAWFKDLRVWEAQPNPNWPATKAKLLEARQAPK